MTEGERAERLSFLRFSQEDEGRLRQIREILAEEADGVIDEFYEWLQKTPELAHGFLSAEMIPPLKKTQKAYLASLGEGIRTQEYFESQLRIGLAHERVGLEGKWYFGAYSHLFELVASRVEKHVSDASDRSQLLIALNKVFVLDSTLASETYYKCIVARLEGALSELKTSEESLRHLARKDGLTGTLNRFTLMEELHSEFERSRRFNNAFSIIMLDLDHFKKVNDTHGHSFGDFVLTEAVDRIRSATRPQDILGRYGGEEFAIGLVAADLPTARLIAERIRLAIDSERFQRTRVSMPVTVSAGVASLSDPFRSIDELLESADQALYRAKDAGRNRVTIHEIPSVPSANDQRDCA